MSIFTPAALYFAAVFSTGFVLGVMRVLMLEPRVGAVWAVAIELPVILAAAFLVARWVVRRFSLSGGRNLARRAGIGLAAFAMLTGAEAAMTVLMGGSLRTWAAGIATTAGAIGLSGQLVFAAMPALVGTQE